MIPEKVRETFFVMLIMFCTVIGPVWGETGYADHVVQVHVTRQSWDQRAPWQKFSPKTDVISGTVVPGNRILTEAYPLADHLLIQVSKGGEIQKTMARVFLKDYNTNLALLEVEDPGFFQDLDPVAFSPSGIPQEPLTSAAWENGGELRTYNAEYLRTYVKSYRNNGLTLCHRMTTDHSGSGRSEPVFDGEGNLAGIISNPVQSDGSVEIIAADSIIRLFRDLEDGLYQGIPFFWLEYAPLKGDVHLKRFLGLKESDEGIYISRIPPYSSGSDVLRQGDVLLKIDGYDIDDLGTITFPEYGKLHYSAAVFLRHQEGDTVKCLVARNGVKQEIRFSLKAIQREMFLIPPNSSDVQPGYFVWGGLLFQELTRDYLTSYGRSWRQDVDIRFLHLYDTMEAYPDDERRSIVILSKVFPDPVNVGYHTLRNLVLLTVDGIPVKDLRHAKYLIDSSGEPYTVFDFAGHNTVVLNRQKVIDSNDEVLSRYAILNAKFLP